VLPSGLLQALLRGREGGREGEEGWCLVGEGKSRQIVQGAKLAIKVGKINQFVMLTNLTVWR